jgi:hypothetical protein
MLRLVNLAKIARLSSSKKVFEVRVGLTRLKKASVLTVQFNFVPTLAQYLMGYAPKDDWLPFQL